MANFIEAWEGGALSDDAPTGSSGGRARDWAQAAAALAMGGDGEQAMRQRAGAWRSGVATARRRRDGDGVAGRMERACGRGDAADDGTGAAWQAAVRREARQEAAAQRAREEARAVVTTAILAALITRQERERGLERGSGLESGTARGASARRRLLAARGEPCGSAGAARGATWRGTATAEQRSDGRWRANGSGQRGETMATQRRQATAAQQAWRAMATSGDGRDEDGLANKERGDGDGDAKGVGAEAVRHGREEG